jgi:glycosyltransferase involved in cell wall biosynthesis
VRILHVTPFYEPFWAYGGMARSASGLCRALARRGHEVTVATVLLEPGAPAEEDLGGVHVRRFSGPAVLNRMLVPWVRGLDRFLSETAPRVDAVHVHGHRTGVAVAAARTLASAGRPWVLQTHGTFPHHGQHVLAKALFDHLAGDRVVVGASTLVAISRAEARDLPAPARVVPNGVQPCGEAQRTRARGRPRMLFVGTGAPQKRGYLLPALLTGLPDAELQVVGRATRGFRRLFGSFRERVTWSGVLAGDALASAYANADVVVHPAVGEAFGLVPFEAALAGTASVVAGGHGCGEWFRQAGGCVVPPDDVAALEDALRLRLADPVQARTEAQDVAEFARRHLDWDQAAQAMEIVYRDVLDERH